MAETRNLEFVVLLHFRDKYRNFFAFFGQLKNVRFKDKVFNNQITASNLAKSLF